MWQVYLWVFGRGWKLVGKFKDEAKARELVSELQPMELQLTWPTGRNQWYGVAMRPLRFS
jgi:hypothetical protein